MFSLIAYIKKYLPDIIIIIGVLILSYNVLRPNEEEGGISLPCLGCGYINYHIKEKMFGIFLIAIGTDIVIRKYLASKNEKN